MRTRVSVLIAAIALLAACVESAPTIDSVNNSTTPNNVSTGNSQPNSSTANASTANASTANASTANASTPNNTTGCPIYFRDVDQDSYGDENDQVESCDGAPEGYVDNADDCNDSVSRVNPDAEEVCNGVDDNCNGIADEDEVSLPPKPCSLTEGVCEGAVVRCVAGDYGNYRRGFCGPTHYGAGFERPSETSCGDQVDNDCDGYVDCRDADCHNADMMCPQTIFVSNFKRTGAFGSVSNIDQLCDMEAAEDTGYDPAIEWRAILSGALSGAISNVSSARAVIRPDGLRVADMGLLFSGNTLANPPEVAIDGGMRSGRVWTGTAPQGAGTDENCGGWQPNGTVGTVGDLSSTTNWLSAGTNNCSTELAFYCLSQP